MRVGVACCVLRVACCVLCVGVACVCVRVCMYCCVLRACVRVCTLVGYVCVCCCVLYHACGTTHTHRLHKLLCLWNWDSEQVPEAVFGGLGRRAQ
jgi:hypothetical protein